MWFNKYLVKKANKQTILEALQQLMQKGVSESSVFEVISNFQGRISCNDIEQFVMSNDLTQDIISVLDMMKLQLGCWQKQDTEQPLQNNNATDIEQNEFSSS